MQRQRQSPLSLHVVHITLSISSPVAFQRTFPNRPLDGVSILREWESTPSSEFSCQEIFTPALVRFIHIAGGDPFMSNKCPALRRKSPCPISIPRVLLEQVACAGGISSVTVPAPLFPRAACTQIYSLRGDMPPLRIIICTSGVDESTANISEHAAQDRE